MLYIIKIKKFGNEHVEGPDKGGKSNSIGLFTKWVSIRYQANAYKDANSAGNRKNVFCAFGAGP